MVSDVHAAFRNIMQDISWMDEETTEAGEQKLDEMLELVGYGRNATNSSAVDETYKNVGWRDGWIVEGFVR